MGWFKQEPFKLGIVIGLWIILLVAACSISSVSWKRAKERRQYENINYIREQILKRKYPGYKPFDVYRFESNKNNA